MPKRVQHIPLDERDPTTVRAAILARSSDTGSKPEDMATQVAECRRFIAAMGWPPVPDALVFTEIRTGMRAVARPVIDEILMLCKQGAVDVVVAREWERVARAKARRYMITETAKDFGVEFRYTNLAKDGGKRPDTWEDRIVSELLDELGQIERDRIVERTSGGKRERQLAGLPAAGGRYSTLYGYAPGERRIAHGRQAGCLTWVLAEDKAPWVKWLFETVAATHPADLSIRQLTSELERRGAPTASGYAHWDTAHVRNMLKNPTYCGQGRVGRYTSEWVKERDPQTGRLFEVRRKVDRLRDPEAWLAETYPIAAAVVPPIVPVEVWERAQEVLRAAKALRQRASSPRRTDPLAHATLLDGGLVRCAVCGRSMTRFWQKRDGQPYYRCHTQASVPHSTHSQHTIMAAKIDALVLAALAHALTDPEELLRIADAEEAQRQQAEDALVIAQAQDAATRKRLAALAADEQHLETALKALAHVPGTEAEVARLRARLTVLAAERQEVLTVQAEAQDAHSAARAVILRSLFTVRDLVFTAAGGLEEIAGSDRLQIGELMTTAQAAAVLDIPAGGELGLPVRVGQPFSYETMDGWETAAEADTVLTADVVYACLRQLPRDRIRALLQEHEISVRVKPPKPRAECAETGLTKAVDRVVVTMHGHLIMSPAGLGIQEIT